MATNVDLTDIDYVIKLWRQGRSMREGSVDNVSIHYDRAVLLCSVTVKAGDDIL